MAADSDGRTPHDIPQHLLPKGGKRLIKAFHQAASPDAVPADMVSVEAGKPAPGLVLPPWQFRYTYEE